MPQPGYAIGDPWTPGATKIIGKINTTMEQSLAFGREDLLNYIDKFINRMAVEARDFRDSTGCTNDRMETELHVMLAAKYIVSEHVFVEDVPF